MDSDYELLRAQVGEFDNGFACITIWGRPYAVPFEAFCDISTVHPNCIQKVAIAKWFFKTVRLNQNP